MCSSVTYIADCPRGTIRAWKNTHSTVTALHVVPIIAGHTDRTISALGTVKHAITRDALLIYIMISFTIGYVDTIVCTTMKTLSLIAGGTILIDSRAISASPIR